MDRTFDAFFQTSSEDISAGASDESPIMLDDVTVPEFRLLLKILFPPYVFLYYFYICQS